MATAKMKIILPLVVWIWLQSTTAQSFGGIGFGIRREVFFLKLEDGYFGCQVNESTDVLQLFELSRLCDGTPDCFLGSDELTKELKCTNDCRKDDGTECQNGACLDGQCHCNDGFGGCSCEVPDENECKYRPCDVFAHCTNTLGSFSCTCYPGYQGDGFHCEDINECDDPAIAARCVENAECCNLPAHFLCKCLPGFEGDAESKCVDINECSQPGLCGQNALCQNTLGNYTCLCPDGFVGNAYDGCVDFDECSGPNVCGPGAICTNLPGGRTCTCPPGYEGDAFKTGCHDSDECARSPCGRYAQCTNLDGSFKCSCPPGHVGDPAVECTDITCYAHEECPSQHACIAGKCQDPCGFNKPCAVHQDCQVQNHQPVCVKVCQCQRHEDCRQLGLVCDGCKCVRHEEPVVTSGCEHCPPGVPCDPTTGACIKEPGRPKAPKPCESDNDCLDSEACYMSVCQDPCEFAGVCADTAKCQAKMHRPICTCPMGYEGNPAIKCFQSMPIGCTSNDHCPLTEACINGACQRPCDVHDPCAQHAVCINTNHGSDCSCAEGYQGNGYVGCVPVDDYKPICQYNEDCPPNKLCDRLNRMCINPCFEDSCGDNAECIPKNHGIDCQCLPGHLGNPYVLCNLVQGCRHNSECPSNLACVNHKCASPCKCGPNAICDVVSHRAVCKCPLGYTGNPVTGCSSPSNPCEPNPCGTNALCELDNGNPICFCPKGLTGNPFKNCIPEGDECLPNPCGPNSGCRLVGGSAVCFCLPEYEGSPPAIPCALPENPCNPSPCGPNTQCTILSNGFAKCTCLPGYLESPNTIRGCIEQRNPCEPNPCGLRAHCDPQREPVCFCAPGLIGNPYRSCAEPVHAPILCQPGPCGVNADCYVSNNEEQCYCRAGFMGDAYVACRSQPASPCVPNPCGNGAVCVVTPQGQSLCQCPDGMGGDPTGGCHGYECIADNDCPDSNACIGHRCRDPCPGSCGINANCRVEKHHPVCTCNTGLTGNPVNRCYAIPQPMPEGNPCMPQPCGLNTVCQVIKGRAVCSCLPDFSGDPQFGCKPECTLNSDCPGDKACLNRKCTNPCKIGSLCGLNAICNVEYHTATCRCPEGFAGDAFIQCIPRPIVVHPIANVSKPCYPSPCELNYGCDIYGGQVAICDPCFGPNAIYHPQCRPECLTNADCPFDKTCLGDTCTDPCVGSCGVNAVCSVVFHTPVCSCPNGLFGNPFDHCSVPTHPEDRRDSCENVQCGSNANCKHTNNALTCACKPGFFGNPWIACRPECVINSDCGMTKACINNKCVDPCSGACGIKAQCEVVNHVPVCFCPPDCTGDPFVSCFPFRVPQPPIDFHPSNPCDPSPCGPFSRCLVSPQGYATCSCLPSYRGAPPACKPECVVSSECPQNRACVNQKCVDPCPGTCGINALCSVINHNPICTCPPGQQGDPFVSCYAAVVIEEPKTPGNPCAPSPCGPNSICQVKQRRPVCSCVADYAGSPPYCRPECVLNHECPTNKACIKEKCVDPCKGSCGSNAKCTVVNHTPFCSCVQGFEGDAFIGCNPVIADIGNPCNPSPCGDNSRCTVQAGQARCSCIPPYMGNPYSGGCRPECTINSDCPSHLACLTQHCRDPCQGLCGVNAECSVVNHVPICTCARGLVGDPFTSCRQEPPKPPKQENPCVPSPCGPNSICRVNNGRAVCSCRANYIGAPPSCRPECLVSSECSLTKACINQKCSDPCPGTCGLNARCQVVNHNPICSCPQHYTGDPFVQCLKEEVRPVTPGSPCVPSPCGPNSECRVMDSRPVCSCLLGMFGAPPNCRPECAIHQDCPSHLACVNNKCRDPCLGSCGFNAQCTVQNHRPMCTCQTGYEGDPFVGCNLVPAPLPTEGPLEPCNPSPCGANAVCKERNGAGSCTCLPEYFGDPYTGCRPECVTNSDCDRTKACVNNKCKDPCPGTCGLNAECLVFNHAPSCTCIPGYTGNPTTICRLIQAIEVETPKNPCSPSPCGPYSECREINGHAVCSCNPGYIGAPPTCKPECVVSSECPQNRACTNQKCIDPCPGTCGLSAHCQVINHNPICTCPAGFTGDPFVRCSKIELPSPPKDAGNPCVPTPCGPNSQCRTVGEQPACSCLPNYVGRPPNCRPECSTNSECPNNLACQNEKCKNPCSGNCGQNAICTVVNHNAICSCLPGFIGDALVACRLPPPPSTERSPPATPCYPNPCGQNAECRENNGAGACICPPNYLGDPYDKTRGCHRECETSNDCASTMACVAYKCIDPCPGTCGILTNCRVTNHVPTCICIPGFTGDPFFECKEIPVVSPPRIPENPCSPSPCGPNSQCRNVDNHSVCSCLPNYVGSPPSCRPECVVSSECPLDKACVKQKCADPCPNTCGLGAQCYAKNHNPICACPPGFTGDPFTRCSPQAIPPEPVTTERPPSCHPSPCGPNSVCQIRNGAPSCSCAPNYVGAPPNCRPECVINSECSSQLACINMKCRDPCSGSCGAGAKCHVLNHVPICTCEEGLTGDPFTQCVPTPPPPPRTPEDPCNPSPCGPNARCSDGVCTCLPEYIGNPYESCRPECVLNQECGRDRACIRNKCIDPCPGTCGQNARCDVINHIPTCSCPEGYTGDPFAHCRVQELPKPESKRDPCHPSPCGPNSQCKNINDHAVCSCIQGFIGTPPNCKPECIVSSECAPTRACVNQKCTDPCLGSCGLGARCEVINHSPICSCAEGQTGDPFQSCRELPKLPPRQDEERRDPCIPTPCGPNSVCRATGGSPSCSCVQGYVGQPPNCRPECVINPDCSSTQACLNNKCKDPCPGSCGDNAECRVISHTVSCSCSPGYTGNPFVQCVQQKTEVLNPCEPSPCGANAVCKERNGAGSCVCVADYQGNPYEGCRPECVLSADCPTNKACVRNKCQDPCPGVCGTNAECNVVNHVPTCTCISGYRGNPFTSCTPEPPPPPVTEATVSDPCNPTPCGPNSQCRNINEHAVCSCMPEYIGSPPNCKPECVVSSECPQDKACHKFKCANPCRGTCGVGARCEVINHNPICSCPSGLTGDPFTRCYDLPPPPITSVKPPSDPCFPSPCGANSQCRPINGQPSCSCLQNFIGAPPNCRPECVVNTDCPSDQACITEKCKNPCQGSCGFNAECRVQNHIPICTCVAGFEGDPFTQCSPKQEPPPQRIDTDPCNPSPCGANAQCRDGICTCLAEYNGDPYRGCRPECTMNTDCAPNRSCSNLKCIDPCPGTCGQGANCDVVNHIPTCSCPSGFEGDPFTLCRPVIKEVAPKEPCRPSPCGPNSVCKVINTVAVCSCQLSYIGSPPSCRPECVVSAECPLQQACLNNKCIDPCPGTCGINARCQVVNHNPICSCTEGFTGDPFTRCIPMPVEKPRDRENPCVPSPCGSNAVCQVRGESPACSCLPNFIGAPPNCRPECTINPECSSNLACINQKCRDPCPGSCGSNAVCQVINHNPVCSCNPGFTGDPFTGCLNVPATLPPPSEKRDPCYPNPCGANARCRVERDHAICECLNEYRGNPYESCRPECIANSDCPMNKACIRNKCQDPCPGTCGINAVCDVINHIPVCTCPRGYSGDAFRQCYIVQQIEPPTIVDPCNPSPCGINTLCRASGQNAICECQQGFFGSPTAGGCRPECTISTDCQRNRACSNMKCIDPCPGVCGFGAVCHVVNHSPVCSCPPPLLGDPFTLCREQPAEPVDPCNPSPCRANGQCRVVNGAATCIYPECVINQDCARDKACYSQKCRDPCRDACGINALCQAINHRAVCTCPAGYVGVPEIDCRIQQVEQPKPECIQDSDCTNDKACMNQQCRNPCVETPNICGANAECRVQLHRAVCICRDGFTGNAQSACFEIGCRSDSDCPAIQACVNRECVDPCSYTQCGINAFCRADSNHRARCYCPDRFRGDPQVRCERPECTADEECPYNLACRNERCEDPCNCGFGAICTVTNHRPQCSCPPGYVGNPLAFCNTAPVVIEPQCKMDADCASKLACFGGVCKNPCVETKPCGVNAECSVVDTLPLRTMSCLCLPGYVGDADVECRLAPQEEPGCKSSDDCSLSEACLNRQCVNPCAIANPCALTAECTPTNHKAVCRCPAGLIGDPFIKCSQVPQNKPECTVDSDCANDRTCFNQRCQDPCAIANPCGNSAICRTNQHRPTCKCPDGWGGNPQVLCYKPECKINQDCPYDKACVNENCQNPCSTTACGRGAECVVQSHFAKCLCPVGTQGNPQVTCIAGVCQYNEDCADHEACDRLNRVCRPVCDDESCAETATCIGRNHQPQCSCPVGTVGNPFIKCLVSRLPEPECRSDSECPSQLACINARCQNPCALGNVCSVDQECRVLDTLPLRTVMCQCPADTFIDENGRCKAVVHDAPQCHVDSDCSDREKCIRGNCVEACRVDLCGINAQCNSRYHQAICTCAPGYTGNPHIECSNIPKIPIPIPVAECYTDDECTYDKNCRNQRCVNPCIDGKPCAVGAFCSVNNHQPICICPAGYEGNPRIKCIPPVEPTLGCKSSSECARSEACVNARCVSPCNCGPNAECKVTNHYPICFCRPGFSGNPQIGCVKLGCQSDNECNNDKQCYNGQCINPCILGDPCGTSAECYGSNHRAACRCSAGFMGNAFERCERVECHVDSECPNNRACIQQRCVDPCAPIANPPCAQNAICYAQNHAAGCLCPSHLPEGNPLAYCTAPVLVAGKAECQLDIDCPSKLACIGNTCVNPCHELSPCHRSAQCSVLDTVPVRTMICTCPEGWVPNNDGECQAVIVPSPPGCKSDDDCPSTEACINRMCRNPCDCGTNSACFVQNHRPICSCEEGFEGNPNIACHAVGCRIDSECETGKACVNGNCINPCIVRDPCGINAECYVNRNRAECRCLSGYRGNPLDRCLVVGCTSNSDCPSDRQCINAQCINPCVYDKPCSPRAECRVQNHMALCRCPPGYLGNPYVDCRREPQPECREDFECPSRLACINNKCQDPCSILEPCHTPAECQVVPSIPVRTMICVCPPGYISSGSGTCIPTLPVREIGGCISDKDCPANRACVQGICKDPCNCGLNAECRIKDHKPVCTCKQGFDGNPEIECSRVGCRSDDECSGQHTCINRQCVPVCSSDGSTCGTQANCLGINHRAICECPPGLQGNPKISCVLIGCRTDTECPLNRACINQKCESPCDANPCDKPSTCRVFDHNAVCACPPGYNGDGRGGCAREEEKCKYDSDCPSQTACIGGECVNPCNATEPCGVNAKCTVLDTTPVRTMICECLPGYQGNAAVQCDKMALCRTDKGFISTAEGNCICPPSTALNENDECILCQPEKGLKIDERGRCVCALERGLIIDERGNCVCPTEFGYRLDARGNCVTVTGPECEHDDHCPDQKFCNPVTKTCDDPCATKNCGINALCNATNHQAICQCITGYTGDAEVLCNRTSPFRTDFPRPEMLVSCLSDGVQVEIHITEQGFNGVLYVKGHSKDEQCRRVVTLPPDSVPKVEMFKVQFGNCGLIHVNGQASFVLVIQKHPKLVTYKAQAYHIKCVYQTGEQNVTLGFNVSMLTTAGTIANTGPPPTCLMKIVTPTGQEINSAEIGDNLILQVDVQPGSIYGGFARSCVAKTMEDNVENEYLVTDENGCATDPTIFGEWDYNSDTQSLLASFNAFKFPSSDNIRFQCNIRVCFGKCQPVNCRGYNAFGRRKREIDDNNTEVAVNGDLLAGQLREEITIQSNAILTFERREERFTDLQEAPDAQRVEDICVSMIGFIIALIITALLALVAVAVAVSCWLMAYRRRPKATGPLPHPPEFPNPLFTTPEPMAEPSPDYLT